ncbi:MAG TPA: DNA mismatch repair endonuclease MutL [Fimbriiglobus sp.]|jgi:DNA mismatch repair protein MutL
MPRIRQLPSNVVTKIAAGEVIERPASVVKELIENSVDAGSTRIEIDLDQGGVELIRVVDDGCGIDPDDLPLAFASHATSKLSNAEDLFRIGTMGFRGEALASVGGVAKVTLQSRTRDRDTGAELSCDGGEHSPVRPWNGSPGTRITVRHLFFNTPVRKKFLKATATELGHTCETVTRLALAHPTLHLTLRNNGRTVYDVPPSADPRDRIGLFCGKDVRDALYPIDSGPGPARLTGFIADPSCDRGNAKLQYLFVNGRWFRDRSLGHAFQEAYRGLLMTGRYAVGFLFLAVPPESVDVNVHPTKSEVRFRDNAAVYSLVRATVKKRLLQEELVPRLEAVPDSVPIGPRPDRASYPEPPLPRSWMVSPPEDNRPRLPFSEPTTPPTRPDKLDETVPVQPEAAQPNPITHGGTEPTGIDNGRPMEEPASQTPADLWSFPTGTALQIHDAYLVLETDRGMVVIDQHALHERILFEQLRTRVRDGQLEVQRLLVPEPIDLPADQAAAVVEVKESLAELGLDVADFGGNTVLLGSYPTLLARRPPAEILKGVVDVLVSKDRPPTKDLLLHNLMATMACKAAVKAGDKLTAEEIAYLLQLREMAEDSHHCPHGRPTTLLFSRKELDRQFKRI